MVTTNGPQANQSASVPVLPGNQHCHLSRGRDRIGHDCATISEVFERYYNQAKMIDAVKAYQEILLANPQG